MFALDPLLAAAPDPVVAGAPPPAPFVPDAPTPELALPVLAPALSRAPLLAGPVAPSPAAVTPAGRASRRPTTFTCLFTFALASRGTPSSSNVALPLTSGPPEPPAPLAPTPPRSAPGTTASTSMNRSAVAPTPDV